MYDSANYFAILPSAVRYNPKLTPRSIILYALLTSLACADGAAYASNKYLSDTLCVSERTAIRLIAELEAERYIASKYEYIPGTKEIAERHIVINELPLLLDMPKTQAMYAVIPSHILSMPELSVQAKLLYAEISAATPTDGFCSKPAAFFAELLHTSETTIQRYTRELVQADALCVVMEYKGDTREIRRRRIYLTEAAAIIEKRANLAADSPKDVASDKQSNAPSTSNTPDYGQIVGGDKNDTTYNLPDDTVYAVRKRKRVKRGKRRKNTNQLRL